MPPAIPLLRKSPFHIDPKPLKEASSPRAGLLAVSRVLRSLSLPALVEANVKIKSRRRGLTEAQYVESAVLLNAMGGDSYEDISLLCQDECLCKGLAYTPPQPTALRTFVEAFHHQGMSQRPQGQLAFIPEPGQRLEDLGRVNTGLLARIAALHAQQQHALNSATIDMDGTIIECHKRQAYWTYEGVRGYQPLVAVWAEADLIVADEFRDGNVPAAMQPLPVVQQSFQNLPKGIEQRCFRGDSACYEQHLLKWLSAPERATEPGGAIEFAISADMGKELLAAVRALRATEWSLLNVEADGARRECAEVPFVPSLRYENKDAQPLRYIALRIVKPQGELFDDGESSRHFAIVTNRDLPAPELVQWHRGKAGTVEHVHDQMKNHLAPQHLPSGKFGANAAWWRLAAMTYNLLSAIRLLALEEPLRRAKVSTLRRHLLDLCGRMNRNNCRRALRFCATPEQIARIVRIWSVFDLPTQATATS